MDFNSNDPNKDDCSKVQIQRFKDICKNLEDSLEINIPSHAMNSNGAMRFVADSNEWVRLGIALYGGLEHPNLKQIFSLKSVISQIRFIRKGQSVGYQNSFIADKDMALTKADIAEQLYEELGLNKREAKEFVEVFFSEISEILVSGLDVKISGFGNFVLRDKKARPGRNPKTGEDVMISSRRVVTFRAGQKLKARVENNAISNE